MDLRLIEATLPVEGLEEAKKLLLEKKKRIWFISKLDGLGLIKVVVNGEEVEDILDLLTSRFAVYERFNVLVLPVEASFRFLEEKKEAKSSWQTAFKRLSREELYQDFLKASSLNLVYVLMAILSTLVAAIAFLKNDLAVLIGAMVIAPFLGPNMGLALGCVLGDLKLLKKATISLLTGFGASFLIAYLMGASLSIPLSSSLQVRLEVSFLDVLLSLVVGVAGSLAFSSAISSIVVGVMVAVALLPPLVATGLLMGEGLWIKAFKSFLLFLINLDAINLAAISMFFIQGLKPRGWFEETKAKKSTLIAFLLWTGLLIGLLFLLPLAKKIS